MQGIIFDIQRFSLHDGPGIRTTVFLKGCPLVCKWCCNPESQEMKEQLSYNSTKCNDSLECVSVCKPGAHSSLFRYHRFSRSTCTNCGDCANVCINDALKFYGYRKTSDEIVVEILKDRDYFKNSDGGLTLSGGEPLHQILFATEILKKAKAENIHTCIETSGFAEREKIEAIAPYTDLFLYDYKITDDKQHLKYTGVSNQKIIENLALLASLKKEIILRCIIVPGVNDNEGHFRAIANLSNIYDNINKVELMLYHDYGSHKFAPLGMEYWPDAPASSTSKTKGEEWLSAIKRFGGKNVFIG
jgi:glycyl-radical enzyme activating protein